MSSFPKSELLRLGKLLSEQPNIKLRIIVRAARVTESATIECTFMKTLNGMQGATEAFDETLRLIPDAKRVPEWMLRAIGAITRKPKEMPKPLYDLEKLFHSYSMVIRTVQIDPIKAH